MKCLSYCATNHCPQYLSNFGDPSYKKETVTIYKYPKREKKKSKRERKKKPHKAGNVGANGECDANQCQKEKDSYCGTIYYWRMWCQPMSN